MTLSRILLCTALLWAFDMTQCYPCLPSDITEDSVVDVVTERSATGDLITKQVTVKQTLEKLKAKCRNGKLIDVSGKPVRFYKLQGCWGNPPADYLEILDKQAKEIEELKKNFTVIELTCNPSGVPLYSIV